MAICSDVHGAQYHAELIYLIYWRMSWYILSFREKRYFLIDRKNPFEKKIVEPRYSASLAVHLNLTWSAHVAQGRIRCFKQKLGKAHSIFTHGPCTWSPGYNRLDRYIVDAHQSGPAADCNKHIATGYAAERVSAWNGSTVTLIMVPKWRP